MDFKQLENLIKIAESNSISAAAEELYITQSALNQQLLRLEGELGVTLFKRSKAGIQPTEAGLVCLNYAARLLSLKKEMADIMNDYSAYKTGSIRIGLPIIRGFETFSNIFPKFYEKYPNIKLEPIELSVRRQLALLGKGELDIAFTMMEEADWTDDAYEYISILDEEIFLAVPAPAASVLAPENQDELSLDRLRSEKFVLIYKESTLRKITDRLFHQYGYKPDVLLETSNHQTISNLACSGYACCLVPKLYISEPGRVRFFHLPERPFWKFCAVRKKNAYLSQPVKDLIAFVCAHWRCAAH